MLKTMNLKPCLALIVPLLLCSCATAPESRPARAALDADAHAARQSMIARDPSIKSDIAHAAAYAIFPNVGKGGVIVGGAFGRGVVFQHGRIIGYASVTAGSVGGQIGGRSYSELLLFESQAALDRFKLNEVTFGAEATAVALAEGSSAQVNYTHGIAVIVQQEGGLMADASLSGQAFEFISLAAASTQP